MIPASVSKTSATVPSGLTAVYDRVTMYVGYSPLGARLSISLSILGIRQLPRIEARGAGVTARPASAPVMRMRTALALILTCLATAALADDPRELPDDALTPGSVYPSDEAEVCGKVDGLTYQKRSRAALTAHDKIAITRAYGEEPGNLGDIELDHRVPAALAGRSDASNVWLQWGRDHGTAWDYHVKDRLDTFGWRSVCVSHTVPLATAQGWFLEPDWRAVYCREMGGAPCP